MNDIKESMIIFLMQLGLVAAIAVALAIRAIALTLPFIILAVAGGICMVIFTKSYCRHRFGPTRVKYLPPPPSNFIIELPRRATQKLLRRG